MSSTTPSIKAALALWWAGVIAPCFAATPTAAPGCTGTATIQKLSDASALASCATYSGDIVVATDLVTADQNHNGHLSLDGIKIINGSLIARDVPLLLSLSGPSLQRVNYDMSFQNLTNLSTIPFPQLGGVGKTFRLQDLPQLDTLNFPAQVEFGAVVIQNTAIRSLDNSSFNVVSAGSVHMVDNHQLTNVSLPINNGQIQTSDILFSGNGKGLTINFPSLNAIQNMTMQNALQVDLQSLNVVSSFMEIDGSELASFHADRLTNVGGSLQFNGVSALQDLSFQELSTVGSDLTINGSQVLDVIKLPALTRVGNNLTVDGTFSNISLPQNPQIQGSYHLESSKNISQVCERLTTSGGVKSSQLTCLYPGSPTQAKNNTATDHPNANNGAGLSTAAKEGIGIAIALAVVILGALAFFITMRRRHNKASKTKDDNDSSNSTEMFGLFGKVELPAGEPETPVLTPATSGSELSADYMRSELGRNTSSRGKGIESRHELNAGPSAMVYELEGDIGASEMHQREKFSFETPREHV